MSQFKLYEYEYRVAMALKPVHIDNENYKLGVYSPLFYIPEEARDYAERLLQAGVIVGYRVQYKLNDEYRRSWLNHEYVKYTPQEVTSLKPFTEVWEIVT